MPELGSMSARSSASTSNSTLARDAGPASKRSAGQRNLGMTTRKGKRRARRGYR
jgi:hypothetical protein